MSSHRYTMSYSREDHVASLRIHDVAANDSGRYRCEASNKSGRVETSCKLGVSGKTLNSIHKIHYTEILPWKHMD